MYKINDYVVYKREVCKVSDITRSKYTNNEVYVLAPVDDATLKIEVPTSNENIRSIIDRKKLDFVVNEIPRIDVIDLPDKQLEIEYKRLMSTDKVEDLVKIMQKIMKIANNEPNDTTGVPPIMLYQKEREYLKPLPNQKLMTEYKNDTISTTVSNSGLIYYKGIRYSVSPDYVNKKVFLTQIGNKLCIYYNKNLIKEHTISEKKINYDKETNYMNVNRK